MIKESKYIIRRVIVGVLIALILSFINSCEVHAEVKLGNVTMSSNNYRVIAIGNITMTFSDDVLNDLKDYQQYYLLTWCTDSNDIISWYGNNNTLTNINFYNTGYKCMFPNSSYTGGHIVYVYGSYNGATLCSATGTNCLHNGSLTFYSPNQSSWALLSYQNSFEVISIDYSSDTIISQNQTLINQNTQIISGQNNIYSKIESESNETQQKIDANTNAIEDVNDTLNDSSIPSDSSDKINNITSIISNNQNSFIVQIATFIPQTLQVILNGFNNSCTGGYSLGSLYGTELIIPCINPVDYLGSFLWGVIDSILCLCYLIPLCKFLINKYNDLTSMNNLRWQ